MAAPRLRADIASLPAYKAGQRPAERTDIVTYKISSNENPYPPLPSVVAAIAEAAATIHRYPDPFNRRLIAALADRFDVPEDHIALGTGSVSLVGQVIMSAAAAGDEVIYAWRSFESYPIWTQMAGAVSVQVPLLPDERHDLDAMAAAVTDRTRVIFLCSPNNPTGQAVTARELEDFLARIPSDIVVVLDEAYAEFIGDEDIHDGVSVAKRHDNVVVLRTFSKAYGLAGLRVGYSIAHPVVTEALRKTALPFGVSSIAEEAALVSLEAEEELLARVHALVEERRRVAGALQEQGWDLHPSYANFVWMRLGERSGDFAAACEEQGITVRAFPGEGVRVTVAETEANDRFLAVAHDFRLSLR